MGPCSVGPTCGVLFITASRTRPQYLSFPPPHEQSELTQNRSCQLPRTENNGTRLSHCINGAYVNDLRCCEDNKSEVHDSEVKIRLIYKERQKHLVRLDHAVEKEGTALLCILVW